MGFNVRYPKRKTEKHSHMRSLDSTWERFVSALMSAWDRRGNNDEAELAVEIRRPIICTVPRVKTEHDQREMAFVRVTL